MKKWIILLLCVGAVWLWLLIKPATPTYVEVTGQVVDLDSNLPIPDADVEIFRFFNEGPLRTFLRWAYRTETVNVQTGPSGGFKFEKIIKDSRLTKGLWTGDIRVSKDGYIQFHQQIFDSMPTVNHIQLRKKYSGQKLPQGTVRSDPPELDEGATYVSFVTQGIVQDQLKADLIIVYKKVEMNELSEQSSYMGYRNLGESAMIIGELRSQEKRGIAVVPTRLSDDLVSAFEELGDCSGLDYKDDIENPGPGIYCVRTSDGHFAKVLLRGVAHGIRWVYQPNGTPDVRSELVSNL